MPRIELETEIGASRDIVFDLARSIDLHKLSTIQTNEEAIAGKTEGLIGLNEWVTWRAKHFGVVQNLTSKITEFDKPNYFVDEMEDGAFKEFKHEHQFIKKNNVTLMIDVFEYKSPFAILRKIADSLFLKRYMKNLLAKRNLVIKEFSESDKWRQVLKAH